MMNSIYKRGDIVRVTTRVENHMLCTYWYRSCSGKDVVIFPGERSKDADYPMFIDPSYVRMEAASSAIDEHVPSWAR